MNNNTGNKEEDLAYSYSTAFMNLYLTYYSM